MLELFRNLFATPRDLILVVTAIWVGLSLAEKQSENHGIELNDLNNLAFYSLMGFVIGGRILFALENISAFTESPLNIFSLNLDLFDAVGGFAVATITAFVYGQRKNLPLWPTLDALTPFFAALPIGLALSHLATGNAFGSQTALPWGVDQWGATRHPSQIYELIASILTLSLLWFRKTDSRPGIYFLTFVALTSGWILFLEAFRGDSTLILNGLRTTQIASWIVLAVSLFLLDKLNKETIA